MSIAVLKTLFDYKSWANVELFDVLAKLEPEHASQLHSCIRTLNHIYVVDRLFRARLGNEPAPFAATNTQATPSLAQLRDDVAATDSWYQDYVARTAPPELAVTVEFTFTDGDVGRMTREEMLMHVLMHGGYHRGNVGQVLKSISIAPPRDLYTKFLHRAEPSRRSG